VTKREIAVVAILQHTSDKLGRCVVEQEAQLSQRIRDINDINEKHEWRSPVDGSWLW